MAEQLEKLASRAGVPLSAFALQELSAYDALDVALAEQLGVTLFTANTRAARTPGLRFSVELLTA